MERGLYVAAAGMAAEQVRQDLVANDLANTATAGYKADRVEQRDFSEVLLASRQNPGAPIGTIGDGPAIAARWTDMTPQPVHDTGQPLDMGIQGDGFFAVRTTAGLRYTRDGQFQESGAGILTDQLGNPVLSPGGATIRVAADGTVPAASVGVFAVGNPVKIGDDQWTGTRRGAATGTVRTGALEDSGADPATTMVDMIESERTYQSGQKVIQTIDDVLSKAANVGSI